MDGEIRIENLHGIGYRMIVPESSGTSP
jgi:hypothetical protein